MAIQEYTLKLLKCDAINNRVKHFVGQIESSDPWNFIPGQFITIPFIHEDKILRRSYSIANSPNKNNIIEFAAGYVDGGPGTQYLFALQPGDTIKMTGPFGRLILKEESPKRYIFIGTSTGITPYRAMLEKLDQELQKNPSLEIMIIQGVQNVQDILFEQDFLNFCHKNPKSKFFACLSKEQNIHQPHHISGRVQIALEANHPHPEEDVVYLCGNPHMIDETTELLTNMGFPIQKIVREKYLSR